jgi:hypothetical protein
MATKLYETLDVQATATTEESRPDTVTVYVMAVDLTTWQFSSQGIQEEGTKDTS